MESQTESTQVTTKAQLQACNLGISITRLAWTKLMAYCRATSLETSGFMLLERDGDLLWIDEVYLLPQESTGTSTEMDRTAIAKFQLELYKKGVIGKKDSKKRLAHWHTHPTFNVFWSGTDMEMRRLNSQGVDYFVSIVVNQKGEALAAIDINGEFPLSINDLPIEVVDNQDTEELIKACKAEVELKVKSPTPAWQSDYTGSGRNKKDITPMWWETGRGGPERTILESETPSDRQTAEAASEVVAQLKLLGPADRRTRKALARVERLTKKLLSLPSATPYEKWKEVSDMLDEARKATRDILENKMGAKAKDTVLAGGDDGITIVEGQDTGAIVISDNKGTSRDEGELWSDSEGTWQNIGGEIVKIDGPMVFD